MKLQNKEPWIFSLGIIIMLILVSPSKVVAIDYTFEEDFSSSELDDWELEGIDWSPSLNGIDPIASVEYYWEVMEGRLVSSREETGGLVKDTLIHNTTTTRGVWEFNLIRQFSGELTGAVWSFVLRDTNDIVGQSYDTFNKMGIAIKFSNQFNEVAIQINENIYRAGKGAEYQEKKYIIDEKFGNQGQDYLYQIIRDPDALRVVIDHYEVLHHPLTLGFFNIKHFGIETQGAISVDNFKETKDRAAVSADIIVDPTPGSSEDKLAIDLLILVSGFVVIGFLSVSILKKKKLSS